MNNTIYFINVTMAFITVWIIYKYINIFFVKKEKTSFSAGFCWIVLYVFQVFVENHKGTGHIWMLIPNIILIFFVGVAGYVGSLLKKFTYTVMLYVVWMLIESIIAFVLVKLMIKDIKYEMFGSIISKIIVIGLISFLSMNKEQRKKQNVSIEYVIKMLFISASSMFIAYDLFLFYLENIKMQTITLMSFVFLLIVNITIFEIYQKLSESVEIEKENIIYIQQMQTLLEHTEEQKKIREDFKTAQHNLINQYIGIKSNINNDKKNQALNTLDELLQECSLSLEKILYSGNELVDAIVSNKYAIAQKYEIDFKIKYFVVPSELPILQKDLCIILGNTLDNAIEAARECKEKKYVELLVGIKKGTLVIVIKNTFEREIKKDKQGNVLTTKENKDGHGYGMRSVKRALERYEGDLHIETNEGQFSLTIVVNLQKF